ncbi:MAG TPA: isoprenylcysteine carboxylmethyltransferase family protein [Ktedonobacterales bacterium]|nr:isoprenylcysteine carboxylmethyltransferase family protein [Ktedonobacterales bacterium]
MNNWQGIVFVLVSVIFSLPIVFYLLTHPALLRRRARIGPTVEQDANQKLIASLLLLGFFALFVVSELDYYSGWSHIPIYVVLIGDLLIAAGLMLFWLVFRANPFAAAAVTVEPEQTVISTGPYALVRHPFYSGGLLIYLGIPVALGSWWGLVLFAPLLALTIWRLKNEETYLAARLPGYRDYCAKVPHRLIPAIW